MLEPEIKKQLEAWTSKFDICEWQEDKDGFRFYILKSGGKDDYYFFGDSEYISCQIVSKDHQRCSDLTDGDLTEETWLKILTDMLEQELYPERWIDMEYDEHLDQPE